MTNRTDYFAFVFFQPHCVWLDDDLNKNDAILMSRANALHKPCCSDRLFIDQICEFWHVDARRARRESGEGEALSHVCGELGII